MLHKFRVLKALKGNSLRQARILLGIKARPKTPVLTSSLDQIVERHSLICRRLVELSPSSLDIKGRSVCEIGPEIASLPPLFIGMGASHVDLVELQPPVVNAKQFEVLSALKNMGFPISLDVISNNGALALNDRLVSYHQHHLENYQAENRAQPFVFPLRVRAR